MRIWNAYLGITVALLVSAWGCSRSGSTGTALTERIQSLEAKTLRLEEDFRSASAQRDQFKRKLGAEEEARAQLQIEVERLQLVVKDLNETKAQLAIRTGERDAMANQYESFRKNLREMLGQAETALAKPEAPAIPAIPTAGLKEAAPLKAIPNAVKPVRQGDAN